MSRTRKAGILALSSYLQFGLSLVSGIVMVPLILSLVGTQSYGLWLACGDLLAYSAMVDLGILNILPWIIAEKDGQKDRSAIGKLISGSLVISTAVGFLYFVIALALWYFVAAVTNVSASEREVLAGPLFLLIASTAVCFPLRTFNCVVVGLQDAVFAGILGIAQWALNIFLLLFLLLKGYGLYALAMSAVLPPMIMSLAYLARVKWIAPDLLTNWGRPSIRSLLSLTKEGLGAWLSSFGWKMMAASNSIIIVAVGSPEMAVVYACTAKMGEILMQMSWLLPDSGLLGLAQLFGEGKVERVKQVIMSMLRLLLITTGGVALLILFVNPHFVSLWVGPDKFGGYGLNVFLAANVVGLSMLHGIIVPTATLGSRLEVGLLTLVQGIIYVGCALLLGRVFGLTGVTAASVLCTVLLALPVGLRLLQKRTGLTLNDLWKGALAPWALRILIFVLAGMVVNIVTPLKTIWPFFFIMPVVGFLYLWNMRSLYIDLPLPHRVRPLLMRMRLIPQG